jgi:hypothetical protein
LAICTARGRSEAADAFILVLEFFQSDEDEDEDDDEHEDDLMAALFSGRLF